MFHEMPKAAATLTLAALLLAGCASSPDQVADETVQPDERVSTETGQTGSRDPWEPWNRQVFAFNETVDDWVLRPVAEGYQFVMPSFADRAVTNFFNNLTEVRNFVNSVLQLKGEHAVVAAGRFTYNTVFGLGGLFDVATAFDLPERPEDFGQTLGYWGVGPGPYLMLPFLGPSSPRDFTGFATETLTFPSLWVYAESPDRYYALALDVVDTRADLISAERFISGDRYVFVRNAYLQRREYLINDGKATSDPFTSGEEEDLMLDNF
ncbi:MULTISPECIES: VacJ family lipoprotein [Marinobacter]|uniref:Phospholipid-binding lipoprotein MlaA n=1 Tax=Marinobacter segnicrescens TaxID=430453 RepID=A0A1I0CYV2_9GAMM|nr:MULTISPECIES: VacJ family lipoprotein [Marinobacter]UZD67507.1 VacJ family lipoprotein [Marinobacter sp. AN1]SET24675.1 phospholipid-binding lipoprotein MlaA [Marinobacter segnicrescens]